ncbi:DJ-1/PfpI family protein [Paraliobacillus sediminis]|uniref:DJ-1/PfpI family protein n=1 Tax=Paraliobacillus sediminis TaxID=1885916 RepID=UPI000E3ED985|nr:DJ-1/PfpI family protein [Paraliobacillus sediminis]
MKKQWLVGLFLFNEVEVLDFAGPFEVLSITEDPETKDKPFQVMTVSEDGRQIKARNGLKVQPDYSFETAPIFDIVIIPGGYGADHIEINNPVVINWIQAQSMHSEILASVCTGAFLLAKAGLLDDKRATTHWMDIEILQRKFPKVTVLSNIKYVDEGHIVTSAGISAGIQMSLHLVRRLLSEEIALQTVKRMEYDITKI